MTTVIIEEFLWWFDRRMNGWHVLLLMDNFSAHVAAAKNIKAIGRLQHTHILFLPENATRVHQPLDQGVIQNFKSYYRRE